MSLASDFEKIIKDLQVGRRLDYSVLRAVVSELRRIDESTKFKNPLLDYHVTNRSNPHLVRLNQIDGGVIYYDADNARIVFAVDDQTQLYSYSDLIHYNPFNYDQDFRIDGNNVDSMVHVDAANDRVGIGTDTPEHTFSVHGTVTIGGVNLIKNYPSLELANGVQPEWFLSVNGTLTEEDATGESITGSPNERVLKVVPSSTYGQVIQRYNIADERLLSSNGGTVSVGMWVYTTSSSAVITLLAREYDGVDLVNLGLVEANYSSVSGLQYLELPALTYTSGQTFMDWVVYNPTNTDTFYVINPVFNVGPTVQQFRPRGLTYRLKRVGNIVNNFDPGGSAQQVDFTTHTSPNTVMLDLITHYHNPTTANRFLYFRPGVAYAATVIQHEVLRRRLVDSNYDAAVFTILCDDSQIITYYTSDTAGTDTESVFVSLRAYWEWE